MFSFIADGRIGCTYQEDYTFKDNLWVYADIQ